MGSKLIIKKIIIVLLFISSGFSKAQNNGGFENWTTVTSGTLSYQDPDNWQTLNFLSLYVNPVSAFKVTGTDKYNGNYALKIVSVYFPNKLISQLPDTFGFAFNGKVIVNPPSLSNGTAYNTRPEKISFYTKYIPVGLDTGLVGVVISRNTPTGRDTIAYNRIKILPNGAYTNYEVNISYRSNSIPDSANIYFKSSSTDSLARRVGSALYIDDVKLVDFVGIKEYEKYNSKIKAFPNPTNDVLNITTEIEEAFKIEIADITGKNIGTYKLQNYSATINTINYKNGNYFYIVIDKINKPLTYGKFSVQH